MAHGIQRDDGQFPFASLEAEIGAIEVKPQRRVESQGCLPWHDQQQLVERGDPRRELGSIAKHSTAVDDPSDPLGRQRWARVSRPLW